jgi:hypothetical protein
VVQELGGGGHEIGGEIGEKELRLVGGEAVGLFIRRAHGPVAVVALGSGGGGQALSEDGHHLDLVCYPEGAGRSYPGITIHRVRAPGFLHGTPPDFTWKKLVKDLLMVGLVLRLVRANRYDVVHAGEEMVFVALLLKTVADCGVRPCSASHAWRTTRCPWTGIGARRREAGSRAVAC